jgi:hypothetical protein
MIPCPASVQGNARGVVIFDVANVVVNIKGGLQNERSRYEEQQDREMVTYL